MFEHDYNPIEYRLMYHWDTVHWTCITTGDNPVDIYDYIKKHLSEMEDAMEGDDAYYSIVRYYDNAPVDVWHGTPNEILDRILSKRDDWLSLAFQ